MDKKQIEHLMNLAKLHLPEKEEKSLASDLVQILNYVEKLNELDISNVKLLTGGSYLANRWSEDMPYAENRNTRESVDSFPENDRNFLKVPKVIDK